jgi:FAD-dependent halogenase
VIGAYDVIIIGGGPAGSTAASLLARAGRRVLVLEKEKFPRYHIGESLVPGVIPVLKDIGALDTIERSGYLHKHGTTLRWGAERDLWTIHFNEAGPWDYAFEVKRAEFDNDLLNHARGLGATVIEEATVTEPLYSGGRCVGVRFAQDKRAGTSEARAAYVLDASGQGRVLGGHENLVVWHEDLRNIAIWTYFQGGQRFPGIDQGNILTEYHEDGWVWVIPFTDGTCSVGFVSPYQVYSAARTTPEEYFQAKLKLAAEAGRLLDGAVRVASYRTTRDWSYACSRFSGPGYLIAGDAAAFVDPLFSTGVMLAMKGAAVAAHTIDRVLADPASEQAQQLGYERSYREFFDTVVSFVRYFYDARRRRTQYWARAQELIDPVQELEQRADFIRLISGLAGHLTVMQDELAVPQDAYLAAR